MLNTPLLSRPSIVALAGGALSYAVLYWLSTSGAVAFSHWWFHATSTNDLQNQIANSPTFTFISVGLIFSHQLVPGFIAGILARRSGLMHGFLTSALLPFVQLSFLFREFLLAPSLVIQTLVITLFLGLLLSSIAGVAGEIVASRLWPHARRA